MMEGVCVIVPPAESLTCTVGMGTKLELAVQRATIDGQGSGGGGFVALMFA